MAAVQGRARDARKPGLCGRPDRSACWCWRRLPLLGRPGNMRLVSEMAYYLALAQLWNLLAGYAGLVSVGQQAFVGHRRLHACSI